MSRIIKADMARFLPRDEEPEAEAKSRSAEDEAAEGAAQDENQPAGLGGVSHSDFQAAYDELIAVAQDEVALLLDDARVEAQKILSSAQQEANVIRNESEMEGYQEGVQRAKDETMGILDQAQREADSILAEAHRLSGEKINSIEPQLMKLALDVAEKVLHYELDRNDEAFMSILTHALDQIRDDNQITLRVNTAEYSRYFNNRDTAKIRTPNANITAHVVVDSSVEQGGCLIENEGGMIDTGVRAQMEQVAHALGMDDE